MSPTTLNADYWSSRYLQNDTGWDIGYGSTPLVEYLQTLTDKELGILIPGCGNAYEAEWLLEHGFTNVTVLDISPVLTAALQEKFKDAPVTITTGDFFAQEGQYDLILEQTFFCAIDPALRNQYVQQMQRLLKPGGKLVGVLFNRSFEAGPPFGGSKEEYQERFSPYLQLKKMELCTNSIAPRKNAELFFIAEKV